MLSFAFSFQETDQLEDEKSALQTEIANLLKEKEKLEFILAAHRPACKIPDDLGFPEEMSVASLDLSGGLPEAATPESEEAFTLPLLNDPEPKPSVEPVKSVGSMELKAEPFDDFMFPVSSRPSGSETARSVPDMDLSGSFYAADWEPLHGGSLGMGPMATELEPLCTPVVTCTPSCTTYTLRLTPSPAVRLPTARAAAATSLPLTRSAHPHCWPCERAERGGSGRARGHCLSRRITERRNTSSLEGSCRPREDLICA